MRKTAIWLTIVIGGALLLFLAGCGERGASEMLVTPGAEWDLVVFGDSSAWGVGDGYAACIEEDLGVSVTVHDMTAPGEPITRVLSRLRDNEDVRQAVREAEVITFNGNPTKSGSLDHPGDWGNCVEPPDLREPGNAGLESFDAYEAHVDAVIDEVFALRRNKPAIIRAMDAYMPLHAPWRSSEVYEGCWVWWDHYNQAIHRACAARGIPVALVYDAFNGPDHHQDPREKGYISSDGMHASWAGREVIAEAFRALGYAPVQRR